MPADAAVLTLGQWLSPSYPVGAFAYSHGLEAAVERGRGPDGPALRDWLRDVIAHGAGRNDATFLSAAYRAADAKRVVQIDATARAFAASKERLLETDRQGAAFCLVTAAVWGKELSGLTYPVALGRAAALEKLPLRLTAKMFLAAFLSNLVAAGQRLLPLGQTEAQAIIRALTPLCAATAEGSGEGDLSTLSATAFLADIAAMHHETQHSRIFRT